MNDQSPEKVAVSERKFALLEIVAAEMIGLMTGNPKEFDALPTSEYLRAILYFLGEQYSPEVDKTVKKDLVTKIMDLQPPEAGHKIAAQLAKVVRPDA